MSITEYLTDILNGDLDKVQSYNHDLINKVGQINGINGYLIPLFSALGLSTNNPEKGREMIEYLLSIPTINVSKIVKIETPDDWTNEIDTVFHYLCEPNIPTDIYELILNHPSMDVNALNTINHDDYTPLDLADEYNPNIVELLESKGAIRNWRVGPGFKPKEDNSPD